MTKILFILILLVGAGPLFAQKNGKKDKAFNLCEGAINIFENGDFHLQFTGDKSNDHIFYEYSSLGAFNTENVLWCSYVAPEDGDLTFIGETDQSFLQMVVFKDEKNAVCADIHDGIAEIQRIQTDTTKRVVGLDYEVDAGIMYSLALNKFDHIMVAFATDSKLASDLKLKWQFNASVVVNEEIKVVDKRHDDFATTLAFKVYDKESNHPIISSLSIEGHRDLDGLYIGSEFYFNLERNAKLNIKCDAEGFFYHDSLYEIKAVHDNEIKIILDRVSSGKSLTISEIEFMPGSSQITEKSIPNLRRLKDFLALNSDLEVEIQGHVFALGDNTIAAQKVSEARAKRVLKYLVQNGIDKRRLTAVGYGNTKPIYEDPKFFDEEQANRRVEILVK